MLFCLPPEYCIAKIVYLVELSCLSTPLLPQTAALTYIRDSFRPAVGDRMIDRFYEQPNEVRRIDTSMH